MLTFPPGCILAVLYVAPEGISFEYLITLTLPLRSVSKEKVRSRGAAKFMSASPEAATRAGHSTKGEHIAGSSVKAAK